MMCKMINETSTNQKAKKAARAYVDCLNSAPNAWGQQIEPTTGLVSHAYLHKMKKICGASLLDAEIDKILNPSKAVAS